MQQYIAGRVLSLVPVILGVSIVVFLVLYLAPGDAAELMLGPQASQQDVERLRRDLGLDQPFHVQYLTWLSRAVRGDLGYSIYMNRPVAPELITRFQATLILATTSLFISTVLGVAAGIISATRQYSWLDKLITVLSLFGVSMPVFWLGLVLMILVSLQLRLLPPTGMYSPVGSGDPLDLAQHLILPAITLAAPSMAIKARLTRSAMLEVLRQDYVRTAQAKGLAFPPVILRHALKNALIPVVTVVGVQVGHLLGGSIVVETVFAWPGVGSMMVQGVGSRDFPVVQAATLLIATVFVCVNLVVDVLYGYLDPRIRYR